MEYRKGLTVPVDELTLEQKGDMYEWCNANNLMMKNDGITISIEEYPPLDIDTLSEQVRIIRDLRISDATWRRERHNDEVSLGLEPTEPLLPILEYIQALRDVPQQEGFPWNVEWPVYNKE